MAEYTPINWATGDVITADLLNFMDTGIVNAITKVYSAQGTDEFTFDVTVAEVGSYVEHGDPVLFKCVKPSGAVYTARILSSAKSSGEYNFTLTGDLQAGTNLTGSESFKLYLDIDE